TKVHAGRESASLVQVSPFRAVWRDLSQAVRDSWDKSTRRTRNDRFSRNKRLSSGTFGPKGCTGHEKLKEPERMESCHVSLPQTRTRKPESGGSEKFVPDSLGHLGQKYVWD
ncbi:hypothetical protein KI387_007405, partial [Taxus chinensis]